MTFKNAHKMSPADIKASLERTNERLNAGMKREEIATYAMIQPCLKNRREYKIVLLNGRGETLLVLKYIFIYLDR
jgi:hypothetical protein